MYARTQGIGIGFACGIAVAIACSRSTATSVVDARTSTNDASATDTPVPDRLRVRTAETDVEQFEEGSINLAGINGQGDAALVVAGPIVITDVWQEAGLSSVFLKLSTTPDCAGFVQRKTVAIGKFSREIHSIRVVIKTGEYLCASVSPGISGSFSWSGYRPYAAN